MRRRHLGIVHVGEQAGAKRRGRRRGGGTGSPGRRRGTRICREGARRGESVQPTTLSIDDVNMRPDADEPAEGAAVRGREHLQRGVARVGGKGEYALAVELAREEQIVRVQDGVRPTQRERARWRGHVTKGGE